jgi:nucleoid-associated protein YgaU
VIYSPVAESPDPVALTASSGVTHVVVKGDTLYRLAREYYGDQSRWKEIYEANRDVLSDPHRLRVGQKLIIP